MNPHSFTLSSADAFPIYVALAFAALACGLYLITAFAGTGRGRESALARAARISYYTAVASIAYATAYLFQCILSCARYDIAYVNDYSSAFDGLAYKISALWAGQGGSLLVWALLIGIVGVALLRRLERTSPVLISFWCSIVAFLTVLLVLDNPFKKLIGYEPGTLGTGMNPLLKNPWMVIHPPVVFLAYALLLVPAALAVQALIDGDAVRFARRCMPWAIAGWIAMTAGLALGMIWSYQVLGWGGYWGWDPVENASLVPWLLATALMHGLVLQQQRRRTIHWNIVLAFATFISVLYATYLTRSGVIPQNVSVHAFDTVKAFRQTAVYAWLKWTPIGYALLFGGLLVARSKVFGAGKAIKVDVRAAGIATGAIVISLLAWVVILGTSYTVFDGARTLRPIFYTILSIPLATAIVLLISMPQLVKLRKHDTAHDAVVLLIAFGVLAVAMSASMILGVCSGFSRISEASVILLLISALGSLIGSIVALKGTSLRLWGAYLAHAGVAVVVLGIILSGTGRSAVVDLTQGAAPARTLYRQDGTGGYSLAYSGRTRQSTDAEAINIVGDRNGSRFTAALRIVGGRTFFPSILSSVFGDLYISPDRLSSTTITPMMTMGPKGPVATPQTIPGTNSALELLGMQVEEHSAILDYMKQGSAPVRFVLSQGKPESIDGYTFSFRGYASNGSKDMMRMEAGVNVGIEGHGMRDVATIRVSEKPYIWLLWLGLILMMSGGGVALVRRRAEKA